MDEIEVLKKKMKKVPKKESEPKYGLSTGSTLLNLALTGRTGYGFLPGKFYYLIGDSASGKTFLALTTCAEACMSEHFKNHRLIFDDVEGGALMDFARYFGRKMAEKVEPPRGTRAKPEYSRTVEDFYYSVDDAAKEDQPFIYILDSMDSLTSEDDEEKFQERKTAAREGKDEKGTYGTSKARVNSSHLRIMNNRLRGTESIVEVISQSREKIKTFGFGDTKTHSGGKSLKFYAAAEMWFSVAESIKKTIRGVPEKVGSILKVKVTKNRSSGREPVIDLLHYPGSPNGFDDTGACIEWLIERKQWKRSDKGKITAKDLEIEGTSYEDLCVWIEENGKDKELKQITADVWADINEKCKVSRKSRYE